MEEETREDTGGIHIRQETGELEPPLGAEEEEGLPEEEVVAEKVTGKRPIHPALIKPVLRLEGEILKELTKYPGFAYSPEELDAATELVNELGLQATPQVQLIILLLSLHAVKFAGYLAWKRKRKTETGELEREEREGEEIRL